MSTVQHLWTFSESRSYDISIRMLGEYIADGGLRVGVFMEHLVVVYSNNERGMNWVSGMKAALRTDVLDYLKT